MSKVIIRIFLVCIITVAHVAIAQAQDASSIQNLQNVNVDELSDQQVQKFIDQMEASGYSEQQLEVLARARGMSSAQMSKLRQRIAKLQSGSSGGGSKEISRGRTSTIDYNRQANDENRSSTFDPFASIFPLDTLKDDSELKIFGLSFFKNQNLTFEPSLSIATPKGYQIGAGDQIIIDVWGASEQTYQLEVSPEGSIIIPSLGPIYLNGLSMERAESRILSKLKAIYSTLGDNTHAQVSLGQTRTINVNVIGEVDRPGTYQMSSFGTAFNALYFAGGPNKKGSLRDVQVFRGGQKVATLDAYSFLIYGEGQNIMLQDQDVLLVKPYLNRISIDGEVKRPAIYEIKAEESLSKLLEFSGGFTDKAYQASISLRRNLGNRKTVQTISPDDFAGFKLQGGDYIEIGAIQDQFIGRVRIEGAVNHPGEFELKEGMMLSDLIAISDGFRADVFLPRAIVIRQNDDLTLSNLAFSPQEVLNGTFDLALKSEDLIRVQSLFDMKENYTVSIQGEVLIPGNYPFAKGMTVENLIYLANGFKETAAKSFVEVARRVTEDMGDGSNASEIFNFPIDQNLSLNATGSQFELQPFDLVVIRKSPFYEKQSIIEIEGEVQYPGKYALQTKNERISDVLKRAGGLTAFAYAKGATLIRRTEYYVSDDEGDEAAKIRREELKGLLARDTLVDKSQQAFKAQESIGIQLVEILENPGSNFDLILKEGDVISIPRELQTVRIRGEVLYPSTVRYDKTNSFNQFISRAGGFADDAKRNKSYVVYANGSAERTRSFLWFKDYPKVEPGAEVIIPRKPAKRKLSPGEIISITTGVGTLALIINNLTR